MSFLDAWRGWATGHMNRRRWLACGWLVVLLCWGSSAWSQALFTNCTTRTYSISPAISGLINVPQTVGATLYTGTVSAVVICDMAVSSGAYILGSNLGTQTYIRSTGRTLSVQPVPGSQVATLTPLTGSCAFSAGAPSYSMANTQTAVTVRATGTPGKCRLDYSFQIQIKVAAVPTTDADWPPNLGPTDNNTLSPSCTFGGVAAVCNWVVQTGNSGSPVNLTADSGLPFSAKFVKITCTLSTPNTTVTLNPAQASDLVAVGATAQRKAFNIDLNGCAAMASPYTVNSTWTYTADAGMATMIANTASSPAANVGIQILDDLDNVIANNAVIPLATVTSAGNFSKAFKAQYVSKGSAGPGAVTGIAQFTLSYQ